MTLGMTYEQFWDGDPEMAPMFRNYSVWKREYDNLIAWLHGLYFYEALCSALSFKKKVPYPKEPHPITAAASEEQKERNRRIEEQKFINQMNMMAASFNKRFENKKSETGKEVGENGRRDDAGN